MFRRWRGYLARRGRFLQVPPPTPSPAPAQVQPDSVRWRTLRTRRGVFQPVPRPPVVTAAAPVAPALVRSSPRRPAVARRGRFFIPPPPLSPWVVGRASVGGSGTTTAALTFPAGTRVGDVAVLLVAQVGAQPINSTSIDATQRGRGTVAGNILSGTFLTKKVTASDLAANSVTVTFGASQFYSVSLVVLSGTGDFDAISSVTVAAAGQSSEIVPAVTPVASDTMEVAGVAARVDTAATDVTHTWPQSFTEQTDQNSTGAGNRASTTTAIWPLIGDAGFSQGPDTAVPSTTVAYVAMRLTVAPGATAPPPVPATIRPNVRRGFVPRRGELFLLPWPAIAPAVTPRAPGLLVPRRPLAPRVIRRARIEPPWTATQPVPTPPRAATISRRRPTVLPTRRGRFTSTPAAPPAGPGSLAPALRSTRRRFGFSGNWARSGRFIEPVWPFVPPPPFSVGVVSAGTAATAAVGGGTSTTGGLAATTSAGSSVAGGTSTAGGISGITSPTGGP